MRHERVDQKIIGIRTDFCRAGKSEGAVVNPMIGFQKNKFIFSLFPLVIAKLLFAEILEPKKIFIAHARHRHAAVGFILTVII